MSSSRTALIPLVLIVGALTTGACSKGSADKVAADKTPAAAAATRDAPAPPPAMPAHAPTAPAADDATTAPVSPAGGAPVPYATGKILETMDSGGYTYVRLEAGKDTIWAATAPMKVKVGQVLTVPLEMPMQNFHSSTLNRDFPLIYFASRVSHGGEPLPPRPAMPTAAERAAAGPAPSGQAPATPPAAPPGQMPPGHPPVGGGKTAITVTEVIQPPAGGQSIAQVWAQRTTLSGKPVVVRGKVVKFLSGIMGRNWIHLQDGTGDAKEGTNDLTVTTDAEARPGDVVTATGTLATDKDFGAGYKYGAIIENATLSK